MDKNGDLTISNFQAGIADSPLLGFSKMNNLEVFEKQGIAKIQFATVLKYNTTSLPVSIVHDDYGNEYVGCEAGQFYVNGVLKGSGQAIYDMKIIADPSTLIQYLLISRQTDLGIWGPLNSVGAVLFSAFGSVSLATGYAKPIIVGQDDIVYIGNGNTVASFPLGDIVNGAKFHSQSPGTVPTLDVSINTQALVLTQGHYVRSMAELGKWLMVGSQGGVNSADSVNVKKARIFPWDRTSVTFNLPVILQENGVNQMLQIGNILYIGAGTRGRMYTTDSSNYIQIKRIPFTYDRQFGTTLYGYPNAIQFHNGELLTGVSTNSDTYPSKSVMGVYSMFLTPVDIGKIEIQYPIVMRNSPSTGGVGATQPLKIGAILSTANDLLYIGWQDGSSYGVDMLNYNLYANYLATLESQFYIVGTELDKTTFKRMEIGLTNPLITGQKIRISYRENQKDDYTIINDSTGKPYFDSTNFGNNNTFNTLANLASKTRLQIKVELAQDNSVAFGNNIELEYIKFISRTVNQLVKN